MSYMSQHMNFPIAGIRVSVEIKTYEELMKVLKGVTWGTFKDTFISPQEYGHTKFNDLVIIAYYLKNHFNLRVTSTDIGYNVKDFRNGTASTLSRRLRRINTTSLYYIGEAMIKSNLLSNKDIQVILNLPFIKYSRSKDKIDTRPCHGNFYKFFAKWYVTGALEKYDNKRRATAKELGVKLNIVSYWADLEVEDIRAESKI